MKKKPVNEQELDDEGLPLDPEPDDHDDEGGKKPQKKIKKEESEDEDEGQEEDDQEEREEEGEEEDIDPKNVPVRKSTLNNIIARQRRTNVKLRSKVEEDEGAGDDEDVDDEEDDDPREEARNLVQKEVRRVIDPLVKTIAANADDTELNDLLRQEPEAKKYEKRIRTYMNHPSWGEVPPSAIYHHLAFKEAQSTGAKKRQIADDEAGEMKNLGRGQRPAFKPKTGLPDLEDMKDMDDEEFETLKKKSLRGKFLKNREQ